MKFLRSSEAGGGGRVRMVSSPLAPYLGLHLLRTCEARVGPRWHCWTEVSQYQGGPIRAGPVAGKATASLPASEAPPAKPRQGVLRVLSSTGRAGLASFPTGAHGLTPGGRGRREQGRWALGGGKTQETGERGL